jgi:hypothetical protein
LLVAEGAARRRRSTAIALGLLAVAPACRSDGLAFRQDRRVRIVAPRNNSVVPLPAVLRWTAHRMRGERFVVLIDVSPMPPGQGLDYFARDDVSCRRADGCPDAQYLANLGVHVTTGTSFTIDALRDTGTTTRTSAGDRHTATIALIDQAGVRRSEAAFQVDFIVERRG